MRDSVTPVQVAVKRDRRLLYVGFAVLAMLIVFIGFSRTYYLKSIFGRQPLSLLTHVHGALFTSWLLLFATQSLLVVVRRTDLHRRLGVAGGVLAALMVPVGTAMGIASARRDSLLFPGSPRPLEALVIPFFDILVFAILVGCAFLYWRRPQNHKRLMVLATIALLPAAFARFPFHFVGEYGPLAFFGLADLIAVACVVYDAVIFRRVHPAYAWGGMLLVASHPARLVIARTGLWIVFARWLTR